MMRILRMPRVLMDVANDHAEETGKSPEVG